MIKNTHRKAKEMGVDEAPPSFKVEAILTMLLCFLLLLVLRKKVGVNIVLWVISDPFEICIAASYRLLVEKKFYSKCNVHF